MLIYGNDHTVAFSEFSYIGLEYVDMCVRSRRLATFCLVICWRVRLL
jgi:hypothetical protein